VKKKVHEVIKMIEKDGWYLSEQKGSRRQYRHPVKKGKVTVPDHGRNDELDHFLVDSILKQAGIK